MWQQTIGPIFFVSVVMIALITSPCFCAEEKQKEVVSESFMMSGIPGRSFPRQQLESLEDFYYATNGPFWVWNAGNDSQLESFEIDDELSYLDDIISNIDLEGIPWNFTGDPNPCSDNWQGISCDNVECSELKPCYVTSLILSFHNLSGTIPNSIGNLSTLVYLDLGNNNITGSIPELIASIATLQWLNFQVNNFSGTIPNNMSMLQDLKVLNLADNKLTGTIPETITTINTLVELTLTANRLSGTMPASIGNLTSCEILEFNQNFLTGTIPNSLFNPVGVFYIIRFDHNNLTGTVSGRFEVLHNLYHLALNNNNFTGSLPAVLSNRTEYLYLNDNFLTGTLPASFGNMTHLRVFDISRNLMTGVLPNTMHHSRLYVYVVAHNMFTGPVPSFERNDSKTSHLAELDISYNALTGTIPYCIYTVNIRSVVVSYNLLSGCISYNISKAIALYNYELDYNFFTCTIPEEFSTLNKINYLYLSDNYFTGSLTYVLPVEVIADYSYHDAQNDHIKTAVDDIMDHDGVPEATEAVVNYTTGMKSCYLNNNLFTGSIPDTLSNYTKMEELSLQYNFLTGTVPYLGLIAPLSILQINNNQLSGTLSNFLNSSSQSWTTLDLSSNFFSGGLPLVAFESQRLTSFAAATNCFTGQIPVAICNATFLTTLSLDGLATATKCRRNILERLGIHTYFVQSYFTGGIPSCLFNMSHIQTLHLSGNGLTGSLPDQMSVSLQDLSLSHNFLTGTIPFAIQERSWSNLDLSYNKLVGTLSLQMPAPATNSAVSLDVNRLSGDIPLSLKYADNISLLTGNLFACDVDRSTIPVHAQDADTYECGSDNFNRAAYIWLVLVVAAAALIVYVLSCNKDTKLKSPWAESLSKKAKLWWSVYGSVSGAAAAGSVALSISIEQDVRQFGQFSQSIRRVACIITIFTLLLLLPLYALLSWLQPTYSYKYAYTVTATFFSGLPSSVALLCTYTILILLVYALFMSYFSVARDATTHSTAPEASKLQWWQRGFNVAVVVFNLAVMIPVDILYVYVILTYSQSVVVVTQIALAVFKLFWNDVAVRSMIGAFRQFQVRFLQPQQAGSTALYSESSTVRSSSYSSASVEHSAIHWLTVIILLNNIVIPCLAIMGVSRDCFYNLLYQAPSVTASFSQCEAYVHFRLAQESVCVSALSGEVVQTTSYDPPFEYSYQCSSVIITNYDNVFVYMFVLIGFVKPVVKVAMTWCYHRESWRDTIMHKIAAYSLEFPLKYAAGDVPADGTRQPTIFNRRRFVVNITNQLVVLITYGVFVPPLAVIVFVGVVSCTVTEQLVLGRFLCTCAQSGVTVYDQVVAQDLQSLTQLLPDTFWIIISFSTLFYAYVVFDPLGDRVGWRGAIWAPCMMLSVPVLLFIIHSVLPRLRRFTQKGDSQGVGKAVGDDERPSLEMRTTADSMLKVTENPLFGTKTRNIV